MFKVKLEFHIHIYRGKKDEEKSEEKSFANCDYFEFARQEISRTHSNQSFSTSRNYGTAVRSLKSFFGKEQCPIDLLNADLMESYEKWLRRRGVCLNTIACYMGSLRAIYNKAVEMGITTQRNPFQKVFTGCTKTEKRAISEQEINRIQSLTLKSGSFAELSRDIFLFCLYALGMPFIDVAFLKKTQIKGREIIYNRHKTGQPIRVKIEPCMKRIIERYQTPDSIYVFPLLREGSPEDMHMQYTKLLGQYNRELKRLARKAKVKRNISSYVVRHSWASIAYQQNVELPVISKALGHTNTNTTLTYIREVNNSRLVAANRKILKRLTGIGQAGIDDFK